MTALPTALFLFGGLAVLSLSMQRHARQAFPQGRPPMSPRHLRLAGWGLIATSLARELASPGWRLGLVEWVGLCGLASALVVVALLHRPRWLPGLAAGSLPAAILLAALA